MARRWLHDTSLYTCEAPHVLVYLRSATPGPKQMADYPYPVYPVGTIMNDAGQLGKPERQINPKSDLDYEITRGWKAADSGQFFTSLNTRGGGHNVVRIEPDERWQLHYEVSWENANRVKFAPQVFVESDEVNLETAVGRPNLHVSY